jgi:putative transposase
MPYNPQIHHRRSIRLKGYDYTQEGAYFITLCIHNRECLLGKIVSDEMQLNDAGRMIEKWYFELENKFPDIKCYEHIVMPNHFHCIVVNVGANVGANLCVRPDSETVGANLCVRPDSITTELDEPAELGEHIGSPLHRVLQWFKTMTTNEYIRGVKCMDWQPFNGKFWQRNYYEHIIRSQQSYQRIAEYIINNPAKWADDKLFKS